MNYKSSINNRKEYSIYGTYKVTTEGDCEGRSTRDLGVHTGYIDEIAFALADKCMYSLRFTMVQPIELDLTPKKDTVQISLDIDSGAWDLNSTDALQFFKNFFKDRNVQVVNSLGYGKCTITTHKETIEEKRAKILSKLSEEEKQILGLTEN